MWWKLLPVERFSHTLIRRRQWRAGDLDNTKHRINWKNQWGWIFEQRFQDVIASRQSFTKTFKLEVCESIWKIHEPVSDVSLYTFVTGFWRRYDFTLTRPRAPLQSLRKLVGGTGYQNYQVQFMWQTSPAVYWCNFEFKVILKAVEDVPFHHHPALGKIQPEERSDKIFISHIAMGLTLVKRFPKNLIFLSRLQAINFLVLLKNKTLIFKEGSFLK